MATPTKGFRDTFFPNGPTAERSNLTTCSVAFLLVLPVGVVLAVGVGVYIGVQGIGVYDPDMWHILSGIWRCLEAILWLYVAVRVVITCGYACVDRPWSSTTHAASEYKVAIPFFLLTILYTLYKAVQGEHVNFSERFDYGAMTLLFWIMSVVLMLLVTNEHKENGDNSAEALDFTFMTCVLGTLIAVCFIRVAHQAFAVVFQNLHDFRTGHIHTDSFLDILLHSGPVGVLECYTAAALLLSKFFRPHAPANNTLPAPDEAMIVREILSDRTIPTPITYSMFFGEFVGFPVVTIIVAAFFIHGDRQLYSKIACVGQFFLFFGLVGVFFKCDMHFSLIALKEQPLHMTGLLVWALAACAYTILNNPEILKHIQTPAEAQTRDIAWEALLTVGNIGCVFAHCVMLCVRYLPDDRRTITQVHFLWFTFTGLFFWDLLSAFEFFYYEHTIPIVSTGSCWLIGLVGPATQFHLYAAPMCLEWLTDTKLIPETTMLTPVSSNGSPTSYNSMGFGASSSPKKQNTAMHNNQGKMQSHVMSGGSSSPKQNIHLRNNDSFASQDSTHPPEQVHPASVSIKVSHQEEEPTETTYFLSK